MADVQIAVIDQQNTQLALAAPEETHVNVAVPGVQGAKGDTGTVAAAGDGTAAAPGISFANDLNTGIYRPGNDQLAISTGGTGRLFVDASGNVGIKTASPAVDLQVIGNARIGSAGTSNWANFAVVGDASIQAASGILHFTNAAGSTRFGYINHTGTGGDFYLLNQEAGAMRFGTGNSERMRIDSVGRVGIGTATPESALQVAGSTTVTSQPNVAAKIGANTTSDLLLGSLNGNTPFVASQGAYPLVFNTNAQERVRIDSAGRLLVRTSSTIPGAYSGASRLQVAVPSGSVDPYYAAGFFGYHNDQNPTVLQLGHSRSASVGHTILQSGDACGTIRFEGSDGTKFLEAASISASVDGTPGLNDMPGRIVFATTADGASSPLERLRIDSVGNVGIGTTNPAYTLDVAGLVRFGAANASDTGVEIGTGATGNRSAFLDLVGDTTYTDYGARFIRTNEGANAATALQHRGTGNFALQTIEAAPIVFFTSNQERGRVDSSGRLLVGTSTASNFIGDGFPAKIHSQTTINEISFGAERATGADVFAAYFTFRKTRSSTPGGVTSVANGDNIGFIQFVGTDGTGAIEAATIAASVDGTPGTNDMPGRLVFSTTADGASSPTERMRIKSTGIVNVGNTPVYADNAAAKTGGLVDGDIYRTSTGDLKIVYT